MSRVIDPLKEIERLEAELKGVRESKKYIMGYIMFLFEWKDIDIDKKYIDYWGSS